jgi:cyclophilin family peptidyl-prolyl cis-trans isomerase
MRMPVLIVMLVILAAAIAVPLVFFVKGCAAPDERAKPMGNAYVVLETSLGAVKLELWGDKAPATVKNFLRYMDEKFYDGTIFHRVISNFMIQGGGFTEDMRQKPAHEPIRNEASGELKNRRGTIAMARTDQLNSATAQFFINVKDNNSLDHRDNTAEGFGYAVFGKVIEGMDVVDRIRQVPTQVVQGAKDVPVTPVVILSLRRAAGPSAGTATQSAPSTRPR